ncbi:MAG: signal peptidase I [Dehalococcoidia bacterium]
MKMDEDNRPDDTSEEEEGDAGWYFDLPKGAWERQEAKNRELRQSVRRNMDSEPEKKEAFGPRTEGRDLKQEEEPPSWRALHGDDSAGEPEGKWSLPDTSADEGASVEYSTEPEATGDLPLSLRSRRLPDEDEHPGLKPPAGLFGHSEPSPWVEDADAETEAPPEEPRPIRRFARDEPEERPAPFVRGDIPAAPPPEPQRSRWGEIFSEKAADGANMLDGMRAWSKSHEADGNEPGTETSFEPAPDDDRADLPAAKAESSPGDLAAAPIPIRVQRHEDDEPPLVNTENPSSRWDQMFGRKAADDAGMLDGMRSWATKPHDGDEAEGAPPRMRLGPETEEVDESLFKPFEWEDGDAPRRAAEGEDFRRVEAEPGEKKGLFGKLFGKKKKDDEAEPAASRHLAPEDWEAEDEAPRDFPGRLSFGRDDEPQGSWLGRSDGTENRFADEEGEKQPLQWADIARQPQAPANSPWAFDDEPAAEDRDPLDDFAREPAPSMPVEPPVSEGSDEPGAPAPDPVAEVTPVPARALADDREEQPATEPWDPFSSLKTDSDDVAWDPEPYEATVATPEDEPASALSAVAQPGADEDPWRSVEEAESEGTLAATEWDPASATAIEAAPADESLVPADAKPAGAEARDDPWAVYMAGRKDDEPKSPDDVPAAVAAAAAVDSVDDETTATVDAPSAAMDEPSGDAPAAELAAGDAETAEEGSSLWDSAFARIHDEQLEEETPDGDAPAPADDPWATIAQASGFEPGSSETSIFRGTAQVEDALERYEAEREAEEAVEATDPEAFPSSVEPGDGRAMDLPAWDDSKRDDDTVLRAFEAHASLYEDAEEHEEPPPANDTEPVVFDELLGEDADEIVAEASQQPVENKYFGRMQGWAPQRSNAPIDRNVFPWETDSTDRVRQPEHVEADEDEPVLEGWSRVEEPPAPWTTTSAAAHSDAPSVRRKSRSRMLVREIVETGLLALLVFLAVRASFQNFKVDGLSMYPTLEDGEYLIVNKLAYAEVDMDRLGNFVPFVDPGEDPTREVFGGPERGDIVVLQDPREEDTDLIKRIIGLPGETIEIIDGEVYINDYLLEEPYIKQEWHDTKAKVLIPEGRYFVMGDNRTNSLDSRADTIGLISKDLIIGKAALTYWPRSKFGLAPNEGGAISDKDGPPVVTTSKLDD